MAIENAPISNQEAKPKTVDINQNADTLMYSSRDQIEQQLKTQPGNLEKQPLKTRLFNLARRVLGGREATATPMEKIAETPLENREILQGVPQGKLDENAAEGWAEQIQQIPEQELEKIADAKNVDVDARTQMLPAVPKNEQREENEDLLNFPDSDKPTSTAESSSNRRTTLKDLLNISRKEHAKKNQAEEEKQDAYEAKEQDMAKIFQMLATPEEDLNEKEVVRLEKTLERRMQKVAQAFSNKADFLGTIAYYEQIAGEERAQLQADHHQATKKDSDQFDDAREEILALEAKLKELPNSDRDVFFALHTQDLLEISRELRGNGGRIVETPYVKKMAREISAILEQGQPIFIHGETGTGKTEIARLVAERFARARALEKTGKIDDSADYAPEFVRGWRGMDQAELTGHMILTSSRDESIANYTQMSEKFEEAMVDYDQKHPDASADDREKHELMIRHSIASETSHPISDFFMGPLYRAARDGKIIVLDEANYIPNDILASLNDVMTKKPGEMLNVQENSGHGIQVKEGFGIIMTGNIGENYKGGRQDSDDALNNRLAFLEYDYLPQAVVGKYGEVKDSDQKQLFEIMLASILDDEGGVSLPKDGLDKIWNLAQFAKLTQLASQGRVNEQDNEGFRYSAGTSLPETIKTSTRLSNRNVQTIINRWLANNKTSVGALEELDSYIYDELIAKEQPPKERVYLYQLAQAFGFFVSNGWQQKPGEDGGWRLVEEGKIKLSKRDYQNMPFTTADRGEVEDISRTQVVESVFGEAPKRAEDKEEKFELDKAIEDLEQWLKDKEKELEPLEKLVDLYCPNKEAGQEAS